MLCNFVSFYGLQLLSPCRTAKLKNHPLSAIRDNLINEFAGRSSIRRYSVECYSVERYCSSTHCEKSFVFLIFQIKCFNEAMRLAVFCDGFRAASNKRT
jgi:hypothetical protein